MSRDLSGATSRACDCKIVAKEREIEREREQGCSAPTRIIAVNVCVCVEICVIRV